MMKRGLEIMERNMIMQNVGEYIVQNVGMDDIDHDLDIFEEGLVSSLFAIELMTYLERNFEVKVTMEDLDMDNFKSVNSICEYIMEKKNSAV